MVKLFYADHCLLLKDNTNKVYHLTCIPYSPKISEKIQYLGRKFNINTVFKTENRLKFQMLRKIKYVYSISCDECSQFHIGES